MSCAATSAATFELWVSAEFNRLTAALARFAVNGTASTAIEYAMILGGIALSMFGVTSSIGIEINDIFEKIEDGLNYGSCIVCVPN